MDVLRLQDIDPVAGPPQQFEIFVSTGRGEELSLGLFFAEIQSERYRVRRIVIIAVRAAIQAESVVRVELLDEASHPALRTFRRHSFDSDMLVED